MRWKTTLILLLAAVGIGAYISLYELRQPAPEERAERARRVVSIAPGAVEQLVIDAAPASVTFTKTPSGWRMSPHNARAEAALLSGILGQLAGLTAERVLVSTPQQPLDPAVYGLLPPAGSLQIVAAGVRTTLRFGSATALAGKQYVSVDGRPEVFVVPSQLFASITRAPDTFRDLHLIGLDPASVKEVGVASAGSAYTLRWDGDRSGWRVAAPFADQADRGAVDRLLNQISQLTFERVADEAPQIEQLASWGLDRPSAEVTVRAEGSAPGAITLFVGGPLPEDAALFYAKRSDEAPLYAVAGAAIESLRVDPSSLRSRLVIDDPDGEPSQLELTREGASLAITQSGEQWIAGGSGARLNADAVRTLIAGLRELTIDAFVAGAAPLAEQGLEAPEAGVITWWDVPGAPPQRIRIGRAVDGAPQRYAYLEWREAVVQVPGRIMELLHKTEASLTEAPEGFTAPAAEDALTFEPASGEDEHAH